MKRYVFDQGCIEHSTDADEVTGDVFYLASDVQELLSRCLSALEDDKLAAAESFEKNAGYPGRQQQLQKWVTDSAALYDEVQSLMVR